MTIAHDPGPVVVAGAGAGGLATVEGLRRNGFAGRLTLISAETELPYDRPPLSKEILTGAWTPDRIRLCSREKAAELDVDLRLGVTVTKVGVRNRELVLSDGGLLSFGSLVAATGVTPRTLPGSDGVMGVHTIRTLADTLALRTQLCPGRRLVVIGGGFLGTEVAAAARGLGAEVFLLEPEAAPLGAAVGAAVGAMVADLHREHGVDVRTGPGAAVARLHAPNGELEQVILADGSSIAADIAVVAIGSLPATGWLAGTGVDCTAGVRCDQFCETTTVPGIYAVGDVSSWYHTGFATRLRLEHRTNAGEQGLYVARRMLGLAPGPFTPVPYFWSDQYDLRIQAYGVLRGFDEVRVIDGAIADREFVALYRRGASLAGVVGVRNVRALRQWRAQLAAGAAWPDVFAA